MCMSVTLCVYMCLCVCVCMCRVTVYMCMVCVDMNVYVGGGGGGSDERWSLGPGSILKLFWGDLFLTVQSFRSFMYVSL